MTSPKGESWYNEMAQLASMDRVTFNRLNWCGKFTVIWNVFFHYFVNLKSSFL